MTDERQRGTGLGSVSNLIHEATSGRLSRREILRRGAALGVSAPMISAMLTVTARTGVAAAPSGDPVVIGSPYNLTGGLASIDVPGRDGGLLAAKELNAKNGILGRPVKLQVYDGKSDVTACTNVAKKLTEEDKVPVMVGLTDTTYALPVGQVAQAAKVPFLITGATAPVLTQIGDYIFLVPFGDNVQAAAGAEFAQERGWKTCALLWDQQSTYCKFLSAYFKARYTDDEIKGKIVTELKYSSGDTDYSSQLTNFKNLNPAPDFFYIASNPNEIGTIIKQARDLGLNQPILGGDGYDTPDLVKFAGAASHDVYFTTHEGIYGDSPVAKTFSASFQKEYGHAPDSVFAALGYDGVNMMAAAIERAESLDGGKVRDALAATKGFQGATGTISYQPGQRVPSKSVVLIAVKDQKFTVVKIVVPRTVPKP